MADVEHRGVRRVVCRPFGAVRERVRVDPYYAVRAHAEALLRGREPPAPPTEQTALWRCELWIKSSPAMLGAEPDLVATVNRVGFHRTPLAGLSYDPDSATHKVEGIFPRERPGICRLTQGGRLLECLPEGE